MEINLKNKDHEEFFVMMGSYLGINYDVDIMVRETDEGHYRVATIDEDQAMGNLPQPTDEDFYSFIFGTGDDLILIKGLYKSDLMISKIPAAVAAVLYA